MIRENKFPRKKSDWLNRENRFPRKISELLNRENEFPQKIYEPPNRKIREPITAVFSGEFPVFQFLRLPLEMFEMFFLVQPSPGGPSDVKKIPQIRIFVTIYQDQLPLETESTEDSTL